MWALCDTVICHFMVVLCTVWDYYLGITLEKLLFILSKNEMSLHRPFQRFFKKMSAEYNSIKGYEHLCTHLYIASWIENQ